MHITINFLGSDPFTRGPWQQPALVVVATFQSTCSKKSPCAPNGHTLMALANSTPDTLSTARSMSSLPIPKSLSRTHPPATLITVPRPARAAAARHKSKKALSWGVSTTVADIVGPPESRGFLEGRMVLDERSLARGLNAAFVQSRRVRMVKYEQVARR